MENLFDLLSKAVLLCGILYSIFYFLIKTRGLPKRIDNLELRIDGLDKEHRNLIENLRKKQDQLDISITRIENSLNSIAKNVDFIVKALMEKGLKNGTERNKE